MMMVPRRSAAPSPRHMLMYISEDDEGAPLFPGGKSALVIPGWLDHGPRDPGAPLRRSPGGPLPAPLFPPSCGCVPPGRRSQRGVSADGAPHQGHSFG